MCAIAAVSAVVSIGRPADAGDGRAARVVVAPFEGPARLAAQARQVVLQAVADRHELVPGKRFADARVGGDGTPGVEEIAEVAAEIRVDAVVIGEVTRRRRGYALRIAVHMGDDGHEVDSATLALRRAALRARDRVALRRRASALIAAFGRSWDARSAVAAGRAARTGDRDRAARERPAAGRRVTRAEKEGTLNPFGPEDTPPDDAAPRAMAAGGAESAAAADSGGGARLAETGDGARAATARPSAASDAGGGTAAGGRAGPARTAWAHGAVTVGGSFVGRQLLFAVDGDIAPGMRPTEFENLGASGLVVAAELHPLAALGAIAGDVGLTFVLDRTFGVKSDFNGQKLDTVQERMGVGLQVVHVFGARADGLAIKAAGGYNRLRHTIDNGDLEIGLPDVDYVYVDAGLGVRAPIVRPLSVFAEARYLRVLSAGELELDQNYGGADASGMDLDAGLDVAVVAGVGVRVGVKLIRVESAFDGTGALAQLDGDGDADVAGATDTYFGGYATMGYRF